MCEIFGTQAIKSIAASPPLAPPSYLCNHERAIGHPDVPQPDGLIVAARRKQVRRPRVRRDGADAGAMGLPVAVDRRSWMHGRLGDNKAALRYLFSELAQESAAIKGSQDFRRESGFPSFPVQLPPLFPIPVSRKSQALKHESSAPLYSRCS